MKNTHAVALGQLGGSVKSERKAAAVRENGRKGGRPQHKLDVQPTVGAIRAECSCGWHSERPTAYNPAAFTKLERDWKGHAEEAGLTPRTARVRWLAVVAE